MALKINFRILKVFFLDFVLRTWYTMKLLLLLALTVNANQGATAVKQLAPGNRDEVLAEDKISFVNFYADWCR